ncbi:uncharacterized protein LY89DRAFT_681043 [Mollisia scopiformis]|uniref:Uncharacterized protein n=1 Tax=Mollisia scopiformis TaxID=149040 RepID=A0A194XNA5_MOLSC|nr:uncharacterized protein LY89DRAFT_681043 [Mollisia scopiformis]KUJ21579.1 hypothetical protein LY89DRAFT_681043 [Mollisia scopiformis]
MLKFSAVTGANSRFASDNSQNTGLVCVFAGATGGIGAGTIERLVVMLQSATFYVLGRSASRFAAQRSKLESLNPSLKIVFLEAELSLIADIDAVSKKILDAEKRVDILYMSQACFPINVPQYTKEGMGIDLCFALQFYSRLRLTSNLLPLLRNSQRPRVLTVLSGGKEAKMLDEDIGLQNPQNYGLAPAISHCATLTTLSLEYLAENDKQITFMHNYPGLVSTDLFARLSAPESFGILGKGLFAVFRFVAATLLKLFGQSPLDSGARQVFVLTSDK